MNKAKMLRDLFKRDGIVRVMGAHDALGAKLAQRAGFDAVWASGLEISTAACVPDANILTMTDFLDASSSMNEAVSVPVIADCDTGFGNSNNVIHMVKKYEAAGIAAVCIEDKHFPKVNSFVPGRQELAPIAEFVGKILAAKNAQSSKDFIVIARVEALIAGWGMDEALKRAHAYAEAGADAILIHSKSGSPREIYDFRSRWKLPIPLIAVPTTYNSVTAKELGRKGIKMVIYANQGMRSAIRAMKDTFGVIINSGSSEGVEKKIASMEEVFDIQGMGAMKEKELKYARTDKEQTEAVIPAAGDHLEEYSMKNISADIPMAMLDINGKPLLQRQVEVLHRCKIYSVDVIVGYKKDKIDIKGAKFINNPEYKTTGILHSIMQALSGMDRQALILYGDIIFDHFIIERMLDAREDITLLIDGSFDHKRPGNGKRRELVITEGKRLKVKRGLHNNALKPIIEIGAHIKTGDACCEFPGIAMLSRKGVKTVKSFYDKCLKKYSGKPFHGSKRFEKALFSDLLQEMILSGVKIYGLEADTGWLEIHSLEDYKLVCATVK